MFSKLDTCIREELSKLERMGSISVNQYSYDDLHAIDSDLAVAISDRVNIFFNTSNDKLSLMKSVQDNSRFKILLVPILSHIQETGNIPTPKQVGATNLKEMSLKYRVLMPFLLNRISSEELRIIGFRKNASSSIWFTTTKIDESGFNCVGYKGESRRINFKDISELGYSKILGSQNELMAICKKEAVQGVTKDDIKKVGIFLAKNTVSGMMRFDSINKLTNFMNKLPDMNISIKNDNYNVVPKV
jgi:hypothetical protein